MFDRFFFSLSMFVFRIFQGLSGGSVGSSSTSSDKPFYINHQARYQDFQNDKF